MPVMFLSSLLVKVQQLNVGEILLLLPSESVDFDDMCIAISQSDFPRVSKRWLLEVSRSSCA